MSQLSLAYHPYWQYHKFHLLIHCLRNKEISDVKKILRTLVVPACALALTLGTATAVSAGSAPAEATISPLTTEIKDPERFDRWRDVVNEHRLKDRVEQLSVYSPSMDREIPVALIKAENPGAPTLYLLNGAGGAEQGMDWISLGDDIISFFEDKNVNVVIPMAGAFSYYIDWHDLPTGDRYLKGPQKWETFLTQELPVPIEEHAQAGDKRGIAGVSMSATSAALLAAKHPELYDAAAGFSGYYDTNNPIAHQVHGLTLQRGGATSAQMLGPVGGEHNVANDVFTHAEGLRGTALYFSNATGLAGETDMPGYLRSRGMEPAVASANAMVLQVEGGVIEAATNASTHNLRAKLNSLGIEAHWELRNTGTHSWPGWHADLRNSWDNTFSKAFFEAEQE